MLTSLKKSRVRPACFFRANYFSLLFSNISIKAGSLFGMLVISVYGWSSVMAQVQIPIVEAGQNQSQSQSVPANNQNEVLINMYFQLEALQTEVQNLRGMVEEQSYQIRRMQTAQRDRYLDTDSRLSELTNQIQTFHGGQQGGIGQSPAANNRQQDNDFQPGNSVAQNPSTQNSTGIAAGAVIAASTPPNEQDLYRQALNLLLEDEAFEDSISLFQQYIDIYSQGRYFTNALYWQGAALELAGRYNQAIVVLQRLIDEFPGDPKAPTAILRLGTVYREMGNLALAIEHWQKISELYPESISEIEIANEYLGNL